MCLIGDADLRKSPRRIAVLAGPNDAMVESGTLLETIATLPCEGAIAHGLCAYAQGMTEIDDAPHTLSVERNVHERVPVESFVALAGYPAARELVPAAAEATDTGEVFCHLAQDEPGIRRHDG